MKSFIPALAFIIGVYFMSAQISSNNYISRHVSNPLIRPLLKWISLILGILVVFTTGKSFLEELTGIRGPRMCDIANTCLAEEIAQAEHLIPYTLKMAQNTEPTDLELCSNALNATRTDWAANTLSNSYVKKAKDSGEQVDTCRIKLGLKGLEEQRLADQTQRIREMSSSALCAEALPFGSDQFTSPPAKTPFVLEAVSRGITPPECMRLLGRTPPPTKPPETEKTDIKPRSFLVDQRTGYPLSTIRNTSSNRSNMRSGPGTEYPPIAQLRNGLEITIAGMATSRSGYPWCEITINNGMHGFVSSDLVTHSCELSPEQIQQAARTEAQNRQQAADFAKTILGVVSNITRR